MSVLVGPEELSDDVFLMFRMREEIDPKNTMDFERGTASATFMVPATMSTVT